MTGRVGFRICDQWERPDPALISEFRTVTSANIVDAMYRLGAMDSGIGPVWKGARVVGSAVTVWTRAGDNLMIHKALTMCKPGDVVVVNAQSDTSRALFGDLMGRSAKAIGIEGLVFDGAVRDVEVLSQLPMPVFARGVTPAGPFKNGPGEIGRPIACGGVVCHSGDIVVADDDGVVVVPRLDAKDVLQSALAIHERERNRRVEIDSGAWQRSGIDDVLTRAGVIPLDQ